VEGHGRLIHGNNFVQNNQQLQLRELNEVLTVLHSPLFLSSLGTQQADFFSRPRSTENVDCTVAKAMSKIAASS
jgi:hypothetical protein